MEKKYVVLLAYDRDDKRDRRFVCENLNDAVRLFDCNVDDAEMLLKLASTIFLIEETHSKIGVEAHVIQGWSSDDYYKKENLRCG